MKKPYLVEIDYQDQHGGLLQVHYLEKSKIEKDRKEYKKYHNAIARFFELKEVKIPKLTQRNKK